MVSALHNTTVTFSKNVANVFMFVLELSCQCHNSTYWFSSNSLLFDSRVHLQRFDVNKDLKCSVVVLIKKQFIQ